MVEWNGYLVAASIGFAGGVVGVTLAVYGAPRAAGGAVFWTALFAYLALEETVTSDKEDETHSPGDSSQGET